MNQHVPPAKLKNRQRCIFEHFVQQSAASVPGPCPIDGPCPRPKNVLLRKVLAEQVAADGGGGGLGGAGGTAASQLPSSVVRSVCGVEFSARFVMKKRKFGKLARVAASAV